MEKKYELLLDNIITFKDKILYRVKALRDFVDVREGDVGGYVESEWNLSHYGNSWIYNEGKVTDDARVMDNAKVKDSVTVQGDYRVDGDTVLKGNDTYGNRDTKTDKTDDSEDNQAAERHNDGKLQWSLVDFECLEPLVRALEYGENKYSSFNWKKGMKQTKIIESLLRHTFAYLGGEDNDTESGVSHIGHIMSNAMFLANSAKSPEWDDRFKGL